MNVNKLFTQTIFRTSSIELGASQIKEELLRNKPSMIARFGAVEIKAILFPLLPDLTKRFFRKAIFESMEINAGFLDPNDQKIKRFSKMMIEDMKLLDILGSWRIEEIFFFKSLHNTQKVNLKALEPYFSEEPWSAVLAEKKILVIHPFSKTIQNQYFDNRHKLFGDKPVLPIFKSLEVIQAVQTIAGNKSSFDDWFSALEHMKNEVNSKDFDIAIIGCGAYGFPLAAHIKRIGKKAVHLGGATQILFGIKGKRWEENSDFNNILNEHFIKPLDQDKPHDSNKVEDGCYW